MKHYQSFDPSTTPLTLGDGTAYMQLKNGSTNLGYSNSHIDLANGSAAMACGSYHIIVKSTGVFASGPTGYKQLA